MTFEEFARSQLQALLGFATVLTGQPATAEDLTQEVLIRAHARWGRIGAMDRRDLYVRKMVLNEFLSWRRRSWRLIPAGDGDLPVPSAPDHAAGYARRHSRPPLHPDPGLPDDQQRLVGAHDILTAVRKATQACSGSAVSEVSYLCKIRQTG
jgi:DNA-directed RNA polymerase specialized sigma24 family protein